MSQIAHRESSAAPTLEPPPTAGGSNALLVRLSDARQLVKPRITALVVITVAIGFAMASAAQGGAVEAWGLFVATLIGTVLACMGASVFNQVWERDTDALMPRTADRPLPAGRVNPGQALTLGIVLSVLGVAWLALATNWLAAGLAAVTIGTYALIYTPLKRVTWLATAIGAFPGAAPPLIGAAAATGGLGLGAWLLFAILFLWQLPHFYAIAWLYREDYARAGLQMLPVIDPTGRATLHQIIISCAALWVVGLLPTLVGLSGGWYFAAAVVAGGGFLALGVRLARRPSAGRARALFLGSLVYLPLVMTLMLLDLAT